MKYGEILLNRDYMQACRKYLVETYGEAVPLQLPSTVEALWNAILACATEHMAWMILLGDHRLPPPNNGDKQ